MKEKLMITNGEIVHNRRYEIMGNISIVTTGHSMLISLHSRSLTMNLEVVINKKDWQGFGKKNKDMTWKCMSEKLTRMTSIFFSENSKSISDAISISLISFPPSVYSRIQDRIIPDSVAVEVLKIISNNGVFDLVTNWDSKPQKEQNNENVFYSNYGVFFSGTLCKLN